MGLATGDAFGVPVEFMSREEVRRIHLKDMVGCDTAPQIPSRWGMIIPAGTWSDDTSMTVAAVESIVFNDGEVDFEDIMCRFLRWWRYGEYSAIDGEPFGLGRCVGRALHRFEHGRPASECGGKDARDNGNGSLMRIFPFSIYCIAKGLNEEQTCELIGNASGITHAHDVSKMGCFIYTQFLRKCLETEDPKAAYTAVCKRDDFREYYKQWFSEEAINVYTELQNFGPADIGETGYVADSLKTAIYSILHAENYEDAVRMAVDFGYDTDTNGAITGSIAGALYGFASIPRRWLTKLKKRKWLERVAEDFAEGIFGGKGLKTSQEDATMRDEKNRKGSIKAVRQDSDKKRSKGTGFAAPAIGYVVPDGLIEKKNPDGTVSRFYPDGTEWKPY